MSKTRKVLIICLAISVIALIIQIINAIINPDSIVIGSIVATGIIPVALCIGLLSVKNSKDNS